MFDLPQEAVGRREVRCVITAHITAIGQSGERLERGRAAQALVGPAVYELEQLDGELDIAQAARAELELPRRLLARHGLLHPAAHRLHVLDEILSLRRLPNQWRDDLDETRAELQVSRDRPRFEQCLELSRLGPALEVCAMAGERAHKRPAAPLGAQVRVHLAELAFRRAL